MKKHFCIWFAVFYTFMLNAQNEDKLYYLHQKNNTQGLLKQYIEAVFLHADSTLQIPEELYINFIPPMGCPRCEGVLIQYNKMLKEVSEHNFVINVIIYPKQNALSEYIQMQQFPGDILFNDTTEITNKIFATNNGRMNVPFITKIAAKQGRMIYGIPILGINLSKEYVIETIKKESFMEFDSLYSENIDCISPVKISVQANDWKELFSKRLMMMPTDSCSITSADSIPFVTYFDIDADGSTLIVNNSLLNSFYLYSQNKGYWENRTSLHPDSQERTLFVDKNINPVVYNYIESINLLVAMYLKTSFTSNKFYIMASLPQVFYEKKDSSTVSLAYHNMLSCLIKDEQNDLKRIFTFENLNEQLMERENYVISHQKGTFFEEDSLFSFQIQRGWPVIGTEAQPSTKEENPFFEDFYTDAQTLLFYNVHDKDYQMLAPLDSLYMKFKLGYYFSSPMVKKCNSQYYWADTNLGKIYEISEKTNVSNLLCDLFDMKNQLQQQVFDPTLTYIESYNVSFSRKIIDFNVTTKDSFIALVKENEHFYLYKKDGKTVEIIPFPDVISGKKISDIQLSKGNRNKIYSLYQNNQEIFTYEFDL